MRFMVRALKTLNCGGAQGARVNPDTKGCVWAGEFILNTLCVDREISESGKKMAWFIQETDHLSSINTRLWDKLSVCCVTRPIYIPWIIQAVSTKQWMLKKLKIKGKQDINYTPTTNFLHLLKDISKILQQYWKYETTVKNKLHLILIIK